MSVDTQPKIGAKVMVGKTPAWVVRHTEDGIAVEFTNELLRHAEIFSNTDSEEDSKSSTDC
jgi:hypothetical protein